MSDLQQWIGERSWYSVDPTEEDAANGALPVFICVARNDSGRYVCTGVMVGDFAPWYGDEPREISARALRSVRLAELVTDAVRARSDEWQERVQAILDSVSTAAAPRTRQHKIDDEFLQQIAEQYRTALAVAPRAPVKWLHDQRGEPEPTLRRWVQRARDKGFLGQTTAGRAGELKEGRA